jgi:hypothetical protein
MDQWKALRDIPYPSTPEAVAPKLFEEPNAAYRYYLNEYGLDRWDGVRVASEIRFAAEWGGAHHVPVWCGEFGVYRPYANPAMRARWIRDVRTALESNKIGWAMWDYCGDFGVVTKSGDGATPDVKILDALGLRAPQLGPYGGIRIQHRLFGSLGTEKRSDLPMVPTETDMGIMDVDPDSH